MPLFLFMFDEDFATFFDTDGIGDEFVIQKTGKVFNGVFEREYIDTNDISGYAPLITCPTTIGASLNRNDIIEDTANRKKYKFILAQPDGTGISRLILEEA